jgi:hypothetical protein
MGFLDRFRNDREEAGTTTPPDTSTWTPKQRERYEQNVAAQRRALDEAEAEWRKLDEIEAARRAALVVEDDSPLPPTAAERRAMAEQGGTDQVRDALEQAKSEFVKVWSPRALKRMLGDSLSEEVTGRPRQERSDEELRRIAIEEWEARNAARAPYRSPDPPAVVISRIPTRGGRQQEQVQEWLQATGLASRPDLVWSVHRVPDRISPNLTSQSEKGRLVEWEVVHHPAALPPSGAAVAVTAFDRPSRWIARRLGEAVPLDEDVAVWFAEWANLDPSRCFGMPRLLTIRSYGGGPDDGVGTYAAVVAGVSVLHVPDAHAANVRRHLEADRPVRPPASLGALRIDRLDWASLAEHVHYYPLSTPTIPSPKPRLPSTPQELLLAYLEVVGITSADCASAAVTTDDRTASRIESGVGPALPCADGKPRRRGHLATEVVLVYRDRPEYAEGRERWAAYQREVMRARPNHLTERRAVLDVPSRTDNAIRNASSVIEAITSPLDWLDWVGRDEPPFVEFPYCWPPSP